MKKLLNSLYISTQGSYVHKERETLVVEVDGEKKGQLPMHALGNIICFGRVMVSPALMGACGEKGINLSFMTEYGKFLARVQGPQTGNVLLRRQQYRLADSSPEPLARLMIGAKIANSRQLLLRHQRNHGEEPSLQVVADRLAQLLKQAGRETDLDRLRGIEGEAAQRYFSCFPCLIRPEAREQFSFEGRNKRPPTDPINALLSFAYSLLTHEIASALQANGIDPYVGFMHRDRPGRLSMALDMLEEFRGWWCDRFVLSLINRKQLNDKAFIKEAAGGVRLTDDARKAVLTAWQERKQTELEHPFLKEKVAVGLLPHIQSLLLARYLRGDLQQYPPFVSR